MQVQAHISTYVLGSFLYDYMTNDNLKEMMRAIKVGKKFMQKRIRSEQTQY